MCGVLGALTLGGDPAPPSLAMLGCSEPWASPLRSGEGNLGPRFPGEHTGHLRCRAAANGHGKASPDQGPGSACSMRRHPDVSWQFQGAPGPPLGRTRDPNFPTEMPHGAQPCSGSGLRRAGDRGPVPAWSSYLSVHQPRPRPGHAPFSPPALSLPGSRTLQSTGARLSLGPWGSGQPWAASEDGQLVGALQTHQLHLCREAQSWGQGACRRADDRPPEPGVSAARRPGPPAPAGVSGLRRRVGLAASFLPSAGTGQVGRRARASLGPIPSRPLHAVWLWASHSTPLSSGHQMGTQITLWGRSDRIMQMLRFAVHFTAF